jgi:pimeloyl-ACP methyl ester carboxylesterase
VELDQIGTRFLCRSRLIHNTSRMIQKPWRYPFVSFCRELEAPFGTSGPARPYQAHPHRRWRRASIIVKDDALVSWENSRILAERAAGAELVLLEPAEHWFSGEQPEQSREEISRFIHAHSVPESR